MPFSDHFSFLRHKAFSATLATAAILCPFQTFFLPLGIFSLQREEPPVWIYALFRLFFLSLGIKLIFSEIAGKKVGREEVVKAGKGEKREGKKREGKKREGQKRQERERGGKAGKKAERERREKST